MIITLLVSIFTKQDSTFPIPIKIILVVMCIIVGLYALLGMFVSWTPTEQTVIPDYGGYLVQGIQGRYFSPLLPFFFVAISNKKIALPKKFDTYALLAFLPIFFTIIMYVLSYTFVN